jgi:hypothetical protein
MLDNVELAPVDGSSDCPAGRGIELGEVTREVGVVAIDRHGEHVGDNRGGLV